MSVGGGKISDEVNRELFEWQGGGRRDRGQWGTSGVMIDFVLLTYSATCNEGIDE